MRTLATIALTFILTSSFCQRGGLKGHVTDRVDKSGFAGLKIFVLDNNSTVTGTITNQTGDFEIDNIKPGTYRIKLQLLGYRESYLQTPITISADKIEQMNLIYPDSCGKSKKICPRGHTDNLIPIVYGLPGKKLMTKSEKGKVRLGGCIVTDCDPAWYCKKHEIEF